MNRRKEKWRRRKKACQCEENLSPWRLGHRKAIHSPSIVWLQEGAFQLNGSVDNFLCVLVRSSVDVSASSLNVASCQYSLFYQSTKIDARWALEDADLYLT